MLSTPPAFILSQDQTLMLKSSSCQFFTGSDLYSFSSLSELLFASTGFTVLFGSFSNLLISRISSLNFIQSFALRRFPFGPLLQAASYEASSLKRILFGIYSGLHYCLFVKVLFVVARFCFSCFPQQLCYHITGFLLCQQLFKTFCKVFC